MSQIVNAVLTLTVMGIIFGAGLAYASKIFFVEINEKEKEVLDALPGANCGACGFAGCSGLANAIANNNAPINSCPVGGDKLVKKLEIIMGQSASSNTRMVARVLCKGNLQKAKWKSVHLGAHDCQAAVLIEGGPKGCEYGCMGYGTCVKVCPFNAININDFGIAEVIEENCVACGKCVDACPKSIIEIKPYDSKIVVECISRDIGKIVRTNCSAGCIACKLCEKNCAFDAVKVENNVAKIDYQKCTQCRVCAQKCPTGAISGKIDAVDK